VAAAGAGALVLHHRRGAAGEDLAASGLEVRGHENGWWAGLTLDSAGLDPEWRVWLFITPKIVALNKNITPNHDRSRRLHCRVVWCRV
jgi:hypothetical protein